MLALLTPHRCSQLSCSLQARYSVVTFDEISTNPAVGQNESNQKIINLTKPRLLKQADLEV